MRNSTVILGALITILIAIDLVSDCGFVSGARSRGGSYRVSSSRSYRSYRYYYYSRYYGATYYTGNTNSGWIAGVVFGVIAFVVIIFILVQVCRKQHIRERFVKIFVTHKGKPVKPQSKGPAASAYVPIKTVPRNSVSPGEMPPQRYPTAPPPPYDPAYPPPAPGGYPGPQASGIPAPASYTPYYQT